MSASEMAGQLRFADYGESSCRASSPPDGVDGTQWICTAPEGHGGPIHAAIQYNGAIYPGATWPIDQVWPNIQDLAAAHGLSRNLFGLGLVLLDDGRRKITLRVTVAASELTEAAAGADT